MQRPPSVKPLPERQSPVTQAAALTGLMIAVMWAEEIVDFSIFRGQLNSFGIEPRDPHTFWHIFTAPFVHAGFPHLIANTVPFAVLAFMSAVRSVGRFVSATFLIVLIGGTLVWLFGRSSVHLGASELIFGYLAYLIGVGWWERTPVALGIAVVAVALYGGIIWGVLPSNPMISWEAHLFGFIGGLLAALLIHGRRPASSAGRPVR
ncbi:rhomboid family intramembrane serine protease [Deinococcus sp.]|uniref:rhomboid family intramembrane serine protease n=1 Tax=Deinococcus sp. TaxID=47478 RepID=UPI0025B92842|nr:rhomboid family intramembrane serine protease [Deinococcus sp.]